MKELLAALVYVAALSKNAGFKRIFRIPILRIVPELMNVRSQQIVIVSLPSREMRRTIGVGPLNTSEFSFNQINLGKCREFYC